MTIRPALMSAGAAALGALLVAPAALAADGESTPLNLPASQPATQAASPGSGGLVRTIVGLAIVLAVIYGLYWVLKQVKAAKQDKASGQGLEPLATLPLGGNRSLQLVRAGQEVVLLGVGEGGVTPIRTYREAEARSLGLLAEAAAPAVEGTMTALEPRMGLGAAAAPGGRITFRQALARNLDDLRRRTVIR